MQKASNERLYKCFIKSDFFARTTSKIPNKYKWRVTKEIDNIDFMSFDDAETWIKHESIQVKYNEVKNYVCRVERNTEGIGLLDCGLSVEERRR